jgi:hypothetical protein
MADKLLDRKWNSLSQLKDYFEKTEEETVVDFNGMQLITEQYVYTLMSPDLRREER